VFKLRERDDRPEGFTVENTVIAPDFELLRHTLADDAVNRDQQWNDLFDSVLGVKKYADQHGAEFLLSTYPWGHQVNDSEWSGRNRFVRPGSTPSDASRERILSFAQANGLRLVDMFPAFRRYDGDEPLYYSFDMHWTPAGHRIAAAELEAAIDRIVPWRREPSAPR